MNSPAQAGLFDKPHRAPIAASADPVTSHQAAAAFTKSGARAARKLAVLDFLRAHPAGMTSFEIARAMNRDRHEIAKRLPDLRRDGFITNGAARICRITGKLALTWCPADSKRNTVCLACHCGEDFSLPASAIERAGGGRCPSCGRWAEASL